VPADKSKVQSHGIKSSDLEAPALAQAPAFFLMKYADCSSKPCEIYIFLLTFNVNFLDH
jgi:hypothetical protein